MFETEYKKKFFYEIESHFTPIEVEELHNLCKEMEETVIDKSSIPMLYEKELCPLLELTAYHFSSLVMNIRRKNDVLAAKVEFSRVSKKESEEANMYFQQNYQNVRNFIQSQADKSANGYSKLFGIEVDIDVLAMDIVKKINDVLMHRKTARANANYYNDLSSISIISERKAIPTKIKFCYENSALDVTLDSSMLMSILKEDFLQFFSHRIEANYLEKGKNYTEIASKYETLLVRLICVVLKEYNLLPEGNTYNIYPGVSIKMPRARAPFIVNLIKKILNQEILKHNGEVVEDKNEQYNYVRNQLRSKAVFYDDSLGKPGLQILAIGNDPSNWIAITD